MASESAVLKELQEEKKEGCWFLPTVATLLPGSRGRAEVSQEWRGRWAGLKGGAWEQGRGLLGGCLRRPVI